MSAGVPGIGKLSINHLFRQRRGGASLREYRLYFLDSAYVGQLISNSLEFEAGSDGAAVELAETIREGRPAELWRGTRKLKVWPEQRSGPDPEAPHIG